MATNRPTRAQVTDGPSMGVRSLLTEQQYEAATEWAGKVRFKEASRQEAISVLRDKHRVTPGSSAALINNYRCMVLGVAFKAPMSAMGARRFIDDIVARIGIAALEPASEAVRGYVAYVRKTPESGAASEFVNILREIDAARAAGHAFEALERALAPLRPSDDSAGEQASEILREVWVRGYEHAVFRRALMRRWRNACSVHGVACNGHLRASHIVPWSEDVSLRASVNNGLLLSVPIDSLFDRGLISFADDGRLIEGASLERDTARLFGLSSGLRISWDELSEADREQLRRNLARHRAKHGFAE